MYDNWKDHGKTGRLSCSTPENVWIEGAESISEEVCEIGKTIK